MISKSNNYEIRGFLNEPSRKCEIYVFAWVLSDYNLLLRLERGEDSWNDGRIDGRKFTIGKYVVVLVQV